MDLELVNFYCEIIGDITNHERYADQGVAKDFSQALYTKLVEKEYKEIPSTLLYFVAYFSQNVTEQVSLYERIIEEEHGCVSSAATNLVSSYLEIGDLNKAKHLLGLIEDEDWHKHRSAEIDEFEKELNSFG